MIKKDKNRENKLRIEEIQKGVIREKGIRKEFERIVKRSKGIEKITNKIVKRREVIKEMLKRWKRD